METDVVMHYEEMKNTGRGVLHNCQYRPEASLLMERGLIDELMNKISALAAAVLFSVSALLLGHAHGVLIIVLGCVVTTGTVSLSVLISTAFAATIAFSFSRKTNPHAQSHRYHENHNTRHYSFHLLLLVFVVPFKIFRY